MTTSPLALRSTLFVRVARTEENDFFTASGSSSVEVGTILRATYSFCGAKRRKECPFQSHRCPASVVDENLPTLAGLEPPSKALRADSTALLSVLMAS